MKQEDGGYKFELGNIKMLVENFKVENDKHLLINPNKAIAYFNVGEDIYGISNEPQKFNTAEAFFDAMSKQYLIFTNPGTRNDNRQRA